MAQPQIRSVADLKGKHVGISSRGGAIDLLTQLIVQKNGLVPNKDVVSLVIGGQEGTVLALRAGRIAAALLTPPRPPDFTARRFQSRRLLRRLYADLSQRRHRRN